MHTNQLIHESSPYLLQHAHNPVNWQAWNEKSLQMAKEQNKLILVSVGYSACHWCHVMERESFEDEEVAGIMNANFINIKVDREERPDVDQVYMQAVQVMTGTGGWPMNVICLPDGRPVWGGTYLQKSHWMQVLQQVAQLYEKNPGKMLDYAGRLKEGLDSLELIKTPREDSSFQKEVLKNIVAKLKKDFDLENGGFKGAPKFMMPGALSFLMRYGFQENQTQILDFVNLSLEKMARGGLYDVVGGGFSRYSVDKFWHVPHFEKMLYDNAQLIRLYAQAWKLNQNPLYKKVVYQSLEFIEDELSEASGGFYSALDADSPDENNKEEEGAYYIWSKAELEKRLGDDVEIFADYFNINSFGKWEEKYVFIQTQTEEKIAENHGLSLEELQQQIKNNLQLLKKERAKRQKPGLDDKSLCSWNALMLTGLIEAYKAFNEIQFLERARSSAEFVKNQFLKNDYSLWHSYKAGKSSIEGFLEDYAFCIEAFLEMYEVTFQPEYLELAQKLTKKCIEDFSDDQTGLFWFTSKQQASLINKTRELTDNVIPASNSVMAHNLFKLGKHLDSSEYSDRAEKMLKTVQDQFKTYPRGYYNWLDLMLNFTNPFYEIAILGPNALILGQQFQKKYLPNTLFAGSTESSKLPLLNYRFEENNDLIYVCEKGSCQLPNSTVEDSIDKIKQF